MRQPHFWNSVNIISVVLLPLSFVYNVLSKINLFIQSLFSYTPKCKVICVGNINIGGTGKTQVVLKLAHILAKNHFKICIVMQGYNGKLTNKNNATIIDINKHSSIDTGDEPLMIAKKLSDYKNINVIINKNKKIAIKRAEILNPDIIIMDDGMQNETVKKSTNICVVDGNIGFGNGFILPAGPLRESIKSGIKKSNAAIIIRSDENQTSKLLKDSNIQIFHGDIVPNLNYIKNNHKKIFAFCSIGRPDKFFKSMESIKLKPDKTLIFPDHYNYKNNDIKKIINKYSSEYDIFTTDKDYVKIPNKYKNYIKVFSVQLKIKDENKFLKFIFSLIKN